MGIVHYCSYSCKRIDHIIHQHFKLKDSNIINLFLHYYFSSISDGRNIISEILSAEFPDEVSCYVYSININFFDTQEHFKHKNINVHILKTKTYPNYLFYKTSGEYIQCVKENLLFGNLQIFPNHIKKIQALIPKKSPLINKIYSNIIKQPRYCESCYSVEIYGLKKSSEGYFCFTCRNPDLLLRIEDIDNIYGFLSDIPRMYHFQFK